MRIDERPIGELVNRCQKWNPKAGGDGTFDYIDLSSVDKDAKSITSIERYKCQEAPSRARQLVMTGDVLVATVRPNLNGVALLDDSQNGMTASTGYCVLRPKEDKLDSRFLFHWVRTEVFVQRMVDLATGANYPAVSDAKVKSSTIPLPSLAVQRRIVNILDAADALRAKRREAIAELDTLLQSTFLEMFGDPVANPMGWEVKDLGYIATFINGDRGKNYPSKVDFVDYGIPFINAGHLRKGKVDFDSMNYIPQEKYDRLGSGKTAQGDILYCLRGSLGKAAIVEYEGDAAIASSLVIIRPGEMCSVEFVFEYLVSPFGKAEIKKFDNGSSQPNLSATSVKRYTLPLPPLDLQRRFASIVKSVEHQKASQRAHLDELDTLFASLQSRAFRGDL